MMILVGSMIVRKKNSCIDKVRCKKHRTFFAGKCKEMSNMTKIKGIVTKYNIVRRKKVLMVYYKEEHEIDEPIYFDTYEEAEAYSVQRKPKEKKRQCGNCW